MPADQTSPTDRGFWPTRFLASLLGIGHADSYVDVRREEELWLGRYKAIIAAIVPAAYLGPDGLLQTPSGAACQRPEHVLIKPPRRKRTWFGHEPPARTGAFYYGGLHYKLLRRSLARVADDLRADEHRLLSEFVQVKISELPLHDTIDLSHPKRIGSLAHEAFHDIQGYLLDYHPHVFDEIHDVALPRARNQIERWYLDPATVAWRGPTDYQLHHVFASRADDVPCSNYVMLEAIDFVKQHTTISRMSRAFWDGVYRPTMLDLGKVEAMPVLLAAAFERCRHATNVLGQIFSAGGLNADFHERLPSFTD